MGTARRTTLAAGNEGVEFLQRNAKKTRIRILHALHKIKEDVSIARSISHNMALGEGHRIAAGARKDVIQILDQKRNLLLSQQHEHLPGFLEKRSIGIILAGSEFDIKKVKYLAAIGLWKPS